MGSVDERARPVWLLDIDGVINALSAGPVVDAFPPEQWEQHVVHAMLPGLGRVALQILVARPVLDFVAAVHESGRAEVLWHSTWRETATTDLAPLLGLPDIPISVAPEWHERPIAQWWKQPAAERVLDSGRPLVWTDDDIVVYRPDPARFEGRPDVLLLSPDPVTGLTAADLDRVDEFLG